MKSDKIEQMDKNEEMSSFKMAERNYIIFKEIADNHFEGLDKNITDYVKELEQQNVELMELLNRSKKIMCEHNMKGFSIVRDINKYLKKGQ